MPELSHGDIYQQYFKNIVDYKGVPVKVLAVNDDKTVKLLFLESQKKETVRFELEHFKACAGRLGMVNTGQIAVFLSRIPVRKMGIGISSANISTKFPEIPYTKDVYVINKEVSKLELVGIGQCLNNKYPPFAEALKAAIENAGCFAFDRQFAVDCEGRVCYKEKHVGNVPKNSKKVSDIVFNKGYEYLSILLEGNHAKTIGITCA